MQRHEMLRSQAELRAELRATKERLAQMEQALKLEKSKVARAEQELQALAKELGSR